VDRVGDGEAPYETSVDVGHLGHVDDLHDAARYLFLDENLATSPAAVIRAFLSPFNSRVDEFNRLMLNSIQGHERKFKFHPSFPRAVSLLASPLQLYMTRNVALTVSQGHTTAMTPSKNWTTPTSICRWVPKATC
jgi:hypothetical protein